MSFIGPFSPSHGATLDIEITPKMSGENLQPASLRYQTAAAETFSITRVSYLLSDFALQRHDGSWLEMTGSVAWLDGERSRNAFRLDDVPAGEFCSIRFSVGLNTNANHADPAKFPAAHPLNPNVNGLHWSWQGGYIFLALEGLWRNAAGRLDGWSYHLARDPNCTSITLAVRLGMTNDTRLDLDFDIASLLNLPRPLMFARDGSSTHSRDGDPIAAALVKNLPGAFRVREMSALPSLKNGAMIENSRRVGNTAPSLTKADSKPLFLPGKFTPYPFQMSATFPVPALPADNPLIQERVDLGRTLFFDKQLSVNHMQACADCHAPEKAFTDGRTVSAGAEGKVGTRNAMPLFNLAWKSEFVWDGRAAGLRDQVLQPIENPVEMHETLTNVVARLSRPGSSYRALFQQAFDSNEITAQKISLALENYLLTLTSFDSRFDRALRGEEKLTSEEQRGLELFSTEYDPRREQFGADCFHCHGGPLFQSQVFANNGLDATPRDLGRYDVTRKSSDAGKFSVPSLRNAAITAPYMHDGRFDTLEAVVEHYATGLKRSATLDPNLAKHPAGGVPLTAQDKKALVTFLKTLTDDRFIQ